MNLKRREVLGFGGIAAALAVAIPAALAQQAATPAASATTTQAAQPAPALPRVVLDTTAGRIVIEVDTAKAPITGANFLRYVDNRKYDAGFFYRGIHIMGNDNYGLIQGGMHKNTGARYPGIQHEPTTQTGLSHKAGVISLARNAPGTGQAEFFIMVGDTTSLDADPSAPGDNLGYAAFGRVVEGMDIVRNIQSFPKSETAEVEAMRGQMLATPIRINTARRVTP